MSTEKATAKTPVKTVRRPAPVSTAQTDVAQDVVHVGGQPAETVEEVSQEERIQNLINSVQQMSAVAEDLRTRLRRAVSMMQISQMIAVELAKGESSTMAPSPSMQQLIDVLTGPITENYYVANNLQDPAQRPG